MSSWEMMQSIDYPTADELGIAMDEIKWGKTGGRTGILLKLILCGSLGLHRLLVLMRKIWTAGCVVKDCKDAELYLRKEILSTVIIGGKSDVVGNLFGRILQDRLKKVLPESHCGFCRGRGCVDMIFAARQLFEKSRECDESVCIVH